MPLIRNVTHGLVTLGIVLAALLAPSLHGQQYLLQTYDSKAGLQSLTINGLLQDPSGFVWVATELGLYRFDGSGFEHMGPLQGIGRGEYVTELEPGTQPGQMWVATQSGLRLFNGKRFEQVDVQGKPLVVDIGHEMAALDDGGLLLVRDRILMALHRDAVGTAWHLRPAFSEAQLAVHPMLRTISSLYRLDGRTWLHCGTMLCELGADGSVTVHGPADGVPEDTWTGMLKDREGTVWIRGAHHVLVRPAGAKSFALRDVPSALSGVVNDKGGLAEDPQGRVLTSTNQGLARWDGSRWEIIDADNGMPPIGITSLLFDRDGTLWLGTYGRGVARWNGYGKVENWAAAQGLDSVPNWSILRSSSGDMWFGNELGGNVLAQGARRLDPWPLHYTPIPRQVLALANGADGAVWIGLYDHRVLRYDPASGKTTLAARLPAFVKVLLVDRDGRLWIGTVNGIYRIDRAGAPAERIAPALTTDSQCSDIAEGNDGTLWFACNDGMVRYAGNRWTRMQAGPQVLPTGFSAVAADADGTLWLGTNEPGVLHATVNGDRLVLRPVADALVESSMAFFIRRDHRGWIWVGNGAGVDVFNGTRWTRLSRDDGLLWDETDQNAFYEDRDGSVWIGLPVGVSHILEPEAMIAASPQRVVITSVTQGAVSLDDGASVRVDGRHAPLIVTYALLGAHSGGEPKFRYRFRGSGWIETAAHVINLTQLPPDAYRVEIQAIDDAHRTVSSPATFDFVVPPPWWRTWWAYLSGISLVLLLVLYGWRWYARRLRRRNRLLERMVSERTAELTGEKQALERARAELYYQATHDSLTGLLSRKAVLDELGTKLHRAAHGGTGLAVGLIDADHFKRINDTLGHQAGDATLAAITRHLQSLVRAGDCLGRYGGEEILVVFPNITQAEAERRMRALQCSASALLHHWQGQSFAVTLSIGMVWLERDVSVEEVIRRADAALYRAKKGGRNRVEMASAGRRGEAGAVAD